MSCCSEVRANLRTDAHGATGHHGNALLRNGFLIHELPLIQQKNAFFNQVIWPSYEFFKRLIKHF
jgi:hypothetical protein